ncbi:hypothetical protein Cagg_0515 [Chloroflexus aggregans DSM 9485]|uniref:Uncharacterized protein n=1 Tax=Chloroflexus aggregans (strain MD-66 / DSM 9485) TaxID=326427 RepID=B8G3S1_CHLAD|nr:hypothetical protein Cagg_0515 [Chloroflexus aggregans DSM 9485]
MLLNTDGQSYVLIIHGLFSKTWQYAAMSKRKQSPLLPYGKGACNNKQGNEVLRAMPEY